MKKLLPMLLLATAGLNAGHAQCSFTLSTSVTNVTCNAATTGSITLNTSGGTAPFTYQLSGAGAGAWVSSNIFPALGAGQYPISAKDASGCIATIYATITEPTAISISPTVTPISCSGAANGCIWASVSGGTPSYTYNWTKNGSAYATTQNLTGLATGNYKLIVTDAAGCQATMPGVAQPVQISMTGYNQDIVANGSSTTSTATTSIEFDASPGSVLFEDQFYSSSNTPGLPTNRQFANPTTTSRIYNLASYSSSNAVQIPYGSGSTYPVTFGATSQIGYGNLYVAASCGNGSLTLGYTVNFSDATTQTGTFTVADWFYTTGASGNALSPVKRLTRTTGAPTVGGDFTLWEYSIPILVGNQTKNVTGITFSYSSGGSSTTKANIMAVAGTSSTGGGIVPLSDGPISGGTPSVTITSTAPGNQFCSGQNVTYTANPTNGGSAPTYQWSVNGTNQAGATSSTYTCSKTASYTIGVTMTAAGTGTACLSTTTATASQAMTMATPAASVTVTANSGTSVCGSASATFTANPTNGGNAPTYQWRKNAVDISGATAVSYTSSSLSNGDQISVRMTSSYTCATGSPATSSNTTVAVSPNVTPSVTVGYTKSGSNINFTSTASNAGGSPGYQWYKNNATIGGATAATYTAVAPASSDYFYLKLTPATGCYTQPAAFSNYVTAAVALPLSWVYFDAKPLGPQVSLTWGTAMEQDVRGFSIERSADAREWRSLGTSPAMGGGTHNFNYSFTDAQPLAGANYYRIRQDDLNGAATYTAIKKVLMDADAATLSLAAAPNPFSNELRIALNSATGGTATLQLTDMSGRVVATATLAVKAGMQSLRLPQFGGVQPGVYQLSALLNGARRVVPVSKIN